MQKWGQVDICINEAPYINLTPISEVITSDWVLPEFHSYAWLPTLFGEIAPGETRVCHFKSALSPKAPPVVALTFHPTTEFLDADSSINPATVYLRRRLDPIPFLSAGVGMALTGLIALMGILCMRIRHPGMAY